MACTKYYAWTAYISVHKVNMPILEECQLKRECPISNVVVVVHLIPLYGKPLLYMITKKLHNDEIKLFCSNYFGQWDLQCFHKSPLY